MTESDDGTFIYTVKREGLGSISVNFAGFKKMYEDVNHAATMLPITGSELDNKLTEKGGLVHLSIDDNGKVVWM